LHESFFKNWKSKNINFLSSKLFRVAYAKFRDCREEQLYPQMAANTVDVKDVTLLTLEEIRDKKLKIS
jgi:hypothetical protein